MRLLDLFCGAGGAAMGYHRAGFEEIVGVDVKPQPRYPFTFVQGDALDYLMFYGRDFDAVHASPPCQRYAPSTRWRGRSENHPDLLPVTRDMLQNHLEVPWVIENVHGSPINGHVMLCGSMFGLRVQRHRYFEFSLEWSGLTLSCNHHQVLPFEHKGERCYADSMGCRWMSNREAREAIPPAYTEFIGRQLLQALRGS